MISQSHQSSHHYLNLITLTPPLLTHLLTLLELLMSTLLLTPLLTSTPLLASRVRPSVNPLRNVREKLGRGRGYPSTDLSIDPSTNLSTDSSTAALEIVANTKVVGGLQDLERDFSNIFTDTRKDLAKCNIEEMRFFLADLFENDEFNKCDTIDEVLRKLRHGHVDTFNVYYLECLISRFHRSDAIMKSIKEYIKKKDKFLKTTTVQKFQQAVVSRAEAVCPKGMAEIIIKVPNISETNMRTMNDVEKLAKKAFKGCHKDLVRIHVTPGSVIITWYVTENLCEKLVRLARENIAVLREEGVEEVSIVGEKSVTLSTQDVHEVSTQAGHNNDDIICCVCVYLQVNIPEITGNYIHEHVM